MNRSTLLKRARGALVVAALIALTIVIGVLQAAFAPPTDALVRTSSFVQSGGATSNGDSSLPDASAAFSHARAPAAAGAEVPTF
jgi:hypothetical protein